MGIGDWGLGAEVPTAISGVAGENMGPGRETDPNPQSPIPNPASEASTFLWGGRFATPLDARALAFSSSLGVDRRLFAIDVLASIAHARMLGRTGIIPADE